MLATPLKFQKFICSSRKICVLKQAEFGRYGYATFCWCVERQMIIIMKKANPDGGDDTTMRWNETHGMLVMKR